MMGVSMATVHEVKSGKHGKLRESYNIGLSESDCIRVSAEGSILPRNLMVVKGKYPPMKSDGCEGSAVPMNEWEKGNGSVARAIDWGMVDRRKGKGGSR